MSIESLMNFFFLLETELCIFYVVIVLVCPPVVERDNNVMDDCFLDNNAHTHMHPATDVHLLYLLVINKMNFKLVP